jgi:heterodisulfide reductase subunit A-like polyferredoxin
MIVGGGYSGVWAASNLMDAGLRVFLVKRTSCTQLPSSQHNQHLSHTRLIDVEGQAGDLVMSPHQEPRSVDIDRCTDYRLTPPITRHSLLIITKESL